MPSPTSARRRAALLAASVLICLSGCASTHPSDPLEPLNRLTLAANDRVDAAVLLPAARLYGHAPQPLRAGVRNFFGNLGDVWTATNNAAQGKFSRAGSDLLRVAVNSTFGLAGLLDVGSELGLPKHREDFGQTLGWWGVPSGPFLILPLFGPSTTRDALGLALDTQAAPWGHVSDGAVQAAGYALQVVDERHELIGASTLLEEVALDRYLFLRDAYLQRRRTLVEDAIDRED